MCVCPIASLYCRVRLLNYPSVVKSAPGYGHRGHASHIERVGFLAHDYRVISCGGADAATYQWRIRGPAKPPTSLLTPGKPTTLSEWCCAVFHCRELHEL